MSMESDAAQAHIRVEIAPGEIRWKGRPKPAGPEIEQLRLYARRTSSELAEIVDAHANAKTPPLDLGDGWVAWPRAHPGSEGASLWLSLRNFALRLGTLERSEFAERGEVLDGPRRLHVRGVAQMCTTAARSAPMSSVTHVHRGGLHNQIAQVDGVIENWLKIAMSDSAALAKAQRHQDSFRNGLEHVAQALAPLMSWSALHAIAEPHNSIVKGYSETIAATLDDARAKLSAEQAAAGAARSAIAELEQKVQALLKELQVTAGATAVRDYQETFGQSARHHGRTAAIWITAAAIFGALAACAAGYFAFFQTNAPEAWPALVHALGPRILIIAIPLTCAIWSARMSTMHRRAQIADTHRVNALSTYVRLSESAPSEEGRTAVLAAVTSCVFGRTASIDHGPDPGLAVFSDLARAAKNARE
ncbi:hypothetical protein [Sandaracinus amylolyticus]|uniref:hypothetical protein n=1 Tax=Sandaracinus amylolyticus TaxID=927083 RepID=UPI00069D3483|nr:hypothetical protein [Sandaracinus amylolyticus]